MKYKVEYHPKGGGKWMKTLRELRLAWERGEITMMLTRNLEKVRKI